MTPKDLLIDAIDPAHDLLERLSGLQSDDRARVLSLAIAGQESAWQYRLQIGGPARSFWQFEKGGGVHGVLTHPATKLKIRDVCADLGISCDTATVYDRMANNDILAACMARLLLYSDPAALPAVGQVEAGWQYYLRNWRPGMPHPQTWPARYATAMEIVKKHHLAESPIA
jgi:hypothetical protein